MSLVSTPRRRKAMLSTAAAAAIMARAFPTRVIFRHRATTTVSSQPSEADPPGPPHSPGPPVSPRRSWTRQNQWLTPPSQDPRSLLTSENAPYFQQQVDTLIDWWSQKEHVLVLTGAGLSTESNIPDYRGHNGSYHNPHYQPMQHQQFLSSHYHRQRYWGRSMLGYRHIRTHAAPNQGHVALARLERAGRMGGAPTTTRQSSLALVTQNVDGLHRRAGSNRMLELHGSLDRVKCMACGEQSDRWEFQKRLEQENEHWLQQARLWDAEQADNNERRRPDGDVEVTRDWESLVVPACSSCARGFLKPDVVFFGDSVPASRVERVAAAVDACDGLLVVGSSLAVHSALRHVRAACQKGTPVAILNVGPTRAESEGLTGILKVEAPAGATLSKVADALIRND